MSGNGHGISGGSNDWRVVVGNWNFTDDAGGVGTFTVFTVTGDVLMKVGASVDVAVTSTSNNGTLELGVAGNTAALLVQDIADNTAFAVGDSWTLITAANANAAQIADEGVIIGNGVDVIMTIGTNAMTAGDIDFYALWRPLSQGATVVAA